LKPGIVTAERSEESPWTIEILRCAQDDLLRHQPVKLGTTEDGEAASNKAETVENEKGEDI